MRMNHNVQHTKRDSHSQLPGDGLLIGASIDALSADLSNALKPIHSHLQPPQPFLALLKSLGAAVQESTTAGLGQARRNQEILWDGYLKLRGYFKKRLAVLRSQSPSKPVETRKWTKTYLEFLKDGQKWFRENITILNRTYVGFAELVPIAGPLRQGTVRDSTSQELVARLCYKALISLGDLCRWRAAEKLDKDPTWGPAIGYYDLAASFRPRLGDAFAQRAIIELTLKNHFKAVHYLYRATMVGESNDNALGNLRIQMSSLLRKWDTDELNPSASISDDESRRKVLTTWFLRIHSLLFQNEPFADHESIETEILTRFEQELRRTKVPTTLFTKLVTVNLAAERTTLVRLQAASSREQQSSFVKLFAQYQRLNILTFSTLLRLWIVDMRPRSPWTEVNEDEQDFSDLALNILPCLRLYSQWILCNFQFLLANTAQASIQAITIEMWRLYGQALLQTSHKFPIRHITELSHMLEEEADLIGFEALEQEQRKRMWEYEDRSPKSQRTVTTKGHRSLDEMLARIRAFQVDGLLVAQQENPLTFEQNRFGTPYDTEETEVENDVPISPTISEVNAKAMSDNSIPRPELSGPQRQRQQQEEQSPRPPLTAVEQDERAMRMVDELVGPDDSPPTAARRMSGLEDFGPDIMSSRVAAKTPSWAPTPPSKTINARMSVEAATHTHLDGSMQSPLLFGSGSMWSTNSGRRTSPPTGQNNMR